MSDQVLDVVVMITDAMAEFSAALDAVLARQGAEHERLMADLREGAL